MKKYTIYAMSLLAFTMSINSSLHGAAVPVAEEETKVRAEEEDNPTERKRRADLYASLSKEVLDLKYKVKLCSVNTAYENDMIAVYGMFGYAMNPSRIGNRFDKFKRSSESYGNHTNQSIKKLTQDIKTLKQQISQLRRIGWWEWITTWKKRPVGFQNVSVEYIDRKTKEKVRLAAEQSICERNLNLLKAENQSNRERFYGHPPAALQPRSVPQYFFYVNLLVRVTKKTDRKRDLMLEKLKLERDLEDLELSNITTFN